MTSRERVLVALGHRQPDRIPLEFGATAVTGVHVSVVAALRDRYGLERRPVKVCEPYQMLGQMDEDLKQAIGIDVEGARSPSTMFGFPLEGWKPWRAPWNQDVLVPGGFETRTDKHGNVVIYPGGDTSAPPSGRLPSGGYFFDTIVRQEPIVEERLDPQDNLEEFKPLTEAEIAFAADAAREAAASGRAVIGGLPGTALGDIALVPAPFLKRPKGIRDIAEWYVSTVARTDYVHAVFARQTEIALANMARLHATAADAMDAVFLCGTDFGTQSSQFCSPDTFRALYKPYYRRMTGWIHAHTRWKVFKHSCGAVEPLMEDFIDCGFDILNPVQCSATGMEPERLKERYGERIVFWGGGVDTQRALPFGTPAEMREQVLRRCEVFSRNGGFVFNAIHNVQAGTPVENVMAMIDAVHEFNGQ